MFRLCVCVCDGPEESPFCHPRGINQGISLFGFDLSLKGGAPTFDLPPPNPSKSQNDGVDKEQSR